MQIILISQYLKKNVLSITYIFVDLIYTEKKKKDKINTCLK